MNCLIYELYCLNSKIMRHGVKRNKLNMFSSLRSAVMRNMATSFISNEKLITTVARAKSLRSYVEKLITVAIRASKSGDEVKKLNAIRTLSAVLYTKDSIQKTMNNIAERFANRNGGYTRIIRLENRFGDNAEMAMLELVDREVL